VSTLNFAFKIRYYRSALTILIAIAAISLNGGCSFIPAASYAGGPVKIIKAEVNSEQSSQTHSAYSPSALKLNLTSGQEELFQYILGLINTDRKNEGLDPVELGDNPAAQAHAQDMLNNYYISHWGTDGLKPYMRYTQAGGFNYEQENDAYHGWHDPSDDPSIYAEKDIKSVLYDLEYAMMNYDGPSQGHRKNILNRLHKKVNLGIAYDSKRVALVQQFEGDYIEYARPPTLNGNILTLSGRLLEGRFQSIQICYDEPPQTLSHDDLTNRMNGSYSLGSQVGYIVPPLPRNWYYIRLSPKAVVAYQWKIGSSGQFSFEADISRILSRGKGVYTIVLVGNIKNESRYLTNYSIFVG
jgi:uncharacterized protein YkwD